MRHLPLIAGAVLCLVVPMLAAEGQANSEQQTAQQPQRPGVQVGVPDGRAATAAVALHVKEAPAADVRPAPRAPRRVQRKDAYCSVARRLKIATACGSHPEAVRSPKPT